MKLLLGLSLIINVWLAFLYWQTSNRPVLERMIIEKASAKKEGKGEKEEKGEIPVPALPKQAPKTGATADGPAPLFNHTPEDFQREAEDIEALKKEFFERQEIPEKVLREKEKIMQEFFEKSAQIYQKHPTGLTLSFEERRRLIDLEEEAQKKVRALFTPKKWEEYKKFVDRYNKKVIEGTKRGESTGVLMGH